MKRLVALSGVAALITCGLVTAVLGQGTQAQEPAEASPPEQSHAECREDGEVKFICGPENPEDLAEVPTSPWVIVSTWQDDGYLSAAHTGDGTTVEIYPGEEPQARQDMELYGDCPGPMPEDFWAHGISLRPGDDQTAHAVRRAARRARGDRGLRGRRPWRDAERHLDRLRPPACGGTGSPGP